MDPRHLWLLRHAKSSWDDPALDDVDRPLAERGIRAANAMAAYLAASDVRPQYVLCSSGLRARQTLAAVLPALGTSVDVHVCPDVYTFDAEVLLHEVQDLEDDLSSVMLVGHNPALHELALMLCGRGDALERLRAKLPTGTLAEIRFAGSWGSLGGVRGELNRFVTPRDLAKAGRDG